MNKHRNTDGVFYKQHEGAYYKVNPTLERITRIENNEVTFLDYHEHVATIREYRMLRFDVWKQQEHKFFMSRNFQWDFEGNLYQTTDNPIYWTGGEAMVFHGGKVWKAYDYYRPRLELQNLQTGDRKWTKITNCKAVEKLPRGERIKHLLIEL
jgi:hypothetical protein